VAVPDLAADGLGASLYRKSYSLDGDDMNYGIIIMRRNGIVFQHHENDEPIPQPGIDVLAYEGTRLHLSSDTGGV
jgi:hypothetical protein